jgi:hypothetical protein
MPERSNIINGKGGEIAHRAFVCAEKSEIEAPWMQTRGFAIFGKRGQVATRPTPLSACIQSGSNRI